MISQRVGKCNKNGRFRDTAKGVRAEGRLPLLREKLLLNSEACKQGQGYRRPFCFGCCFEP